MREGRKGRLYCTYICGGKKKISLHLFRLPFVSIHPCEFRCMGEKCRLRARSFNPVCPDRECGNRHQPGLTWFMNSETRFQQLGLEFGWPHVNTSELSFLGKKRKVMTTSLYLLQISNVERGRRRVYKCQLNKINSSHRKKQCQE